LFIGTCAGSAGGLSAQVSNVPEPTVLGDGRPVPGSPEVIARNERGVTVRATRIHTPMLEERDSEAAPGVPGLQNRSLVVKVNRFLRF
jgi:hypothetical protein